MSGESIIFLEIILTFPQKVKEIVLFKVVKPELMDLKIARLTLESFTVRTTNRDVPVDHKITSINSSFLIKNDFLSVPFLDTSHITKN